MDYTNVQHKYNMENARFIHENVDEEMENFVQGKYTNRVIFKAH